MFTGIKKVCLTFPLLLVWIIFFCRQNRVILKFRKNKKWNLETLDKNMEDYIKEADRIREKIKEADETLAGQEGNG